MRPETKRLLDRLEGVRRNGNGWMALCPAHADRNPSLSITEAEDGILIHCFAGCTPDAVCSAAGIEMRDLFYGGGPGPYEAATYGYSDENGELLYQVVRYVPKDFRMRRPDGRGGWSWNLEGTRRVLYNLPAVVTATSVVLCEGEKDCETAKKLGLMATCNQGGAGKWRNEYTESLKGKHVSIIADADEPGRKHARLVAAALQGTAASVKVVELLPAKDLTEWVNSGGKAEELQEILESTPEWPIDKLSSDESGTRQQAESSDERKTQAELLVELATDAELFHTNERIAYATIAVKQHREHWQVQSKEFKHWLVERFYRERGRGPNARALQEAVLTIEARANYDGQERAVAVRLVDHSGKIYMDLADPDWQAVEIEALGWRVVQDPPVAFIRTGGMEPLPVPEIGGDVQELRQFINAEGDPWVLLLSCLLAMLRPQGPYPVLVLHGEQGSAKTTTERVLKRLVDPNRADTRCEPKEIRDLMIAANNGWVLALDNLSRLQPWLSDALCRLSTGGGFATRELYSNDREVIFQAQRPLILNGIEEVVTRGDLLDRSLIVELPAIPDERRRDEEEFWAEFEAARPRILGALLSAVAKGLQRLPAVKLRALPRMADFAKWATACEPALGLPEGSVIKAYQENIASANELVLEASPIVEHLRDIGSFEGQAQELLDELLKRAGEVAPRRPGWPKGPRGLSGSLRRLAPSLRRAGLSVDFRRSNGERLIALGPVCDPLADASAGSAGSADRLLGNGFSPGGAEGRLGAGPALNHHGATDPTGASGTDNLDKDAEMSASLDFELPAADVTSSGIANGEAVEKFGRSTKFIAHIGKKVVTPLGEGILKQFLGPRVRVSLLKSPGTMTDFRADEIVLLEE